MPKKVLIIDDDPDLMKMYQIKLVHAGYQVSLAVNGQEGWEKLNDEKPDLAVLDYGMPVMDGLKLLEKIRKDPQLKQLPVVFLSNSAIVEQRQHAYKLQVKDFLTKIECTPAQLVTLVNKYLH